MTRIRLAAVAALAGALAFTGVAARADTTTTTSAAESPRRIDEARRRFCLAEIDKRIVALDARQRELVNAAHLTDANRAALNANIDATRAGLQALAPQIRDETDPVALKRECESIWTNYRVFVLVLPRTRLVVVADSEVFAAGKLSDAAVRLQQAIDAAEAAGHDVAKAQSDLDAMKAKTASAHATAGAIPASIMNLTPADWNANHDVLKPAHDSAKSAHDDLKAARDLARQVIADLKA